MLAENGVALPSNAHKKDYYVGLFREFQERKRKDIAEGRRASIHPIVIEKVEVESLLGKRRKRKKASTEPVSDSDWTGFTPAKRDGCTPSRVSFGRVTTFAEPGEMAREGKEKDGKEKRGGEEVTPRKAVAKEKKPREGKEKDGKEKRGGEEVTPRKAVAKEKKPREVKQDSDGDSDEGKGKSRSGKGGHGKKEKEVGTKTVVKKRVVKKVPKQDEEKERERAEEEHHAEKEEKDEQKEGKETEKETKLEEGKEKKVPKQDEEKERERAEEEHHAEKEEKDEQKEGKETEKETKLEEGKEKKCSTPDCDLNECEFQLTAAVDRLRKEYEASLPRACVSGQQQNVLVPVTVAVPLFAVPLLYKFLAETVTPFPRN
eukprot:TRINITY_DN5744_c0_g1_i1.p2 TRINITY_DN5744_c0_g1~~TRINITY_DN5744_c0_g1_i1.p2  ORF type:complete len:398 (+),score=155.95 TRINITY_DN5744_c0_g1_i1:73-1194(+)